MGKRDVCTHQIVVRRERERDRKRKLAVNQASA
jgi:hypothetical protein